MNALIGWNPRPKDVDSNPTPRAYLGIYTIILIVIEKQTMTERQNWRMIKFLLMRNNRKRNYGSLKESTL